jgi:glyoxylase-like metal-dependent hydrolase (beta-lactamase superfamily II)
MLNIYTLPLGDYQTNTYIVTGNSKSCAVIDPGFEPKAILDKVAQLGLSVDAVLLTHGHFDHVGGVESIVRTTGCELWMHEGDWSQPNDPMSRYFYPIGNCDFTNVSFCEDGQQIHAGGLDFTVCATPGHTPGSVCYLCGDALFSGDTLFALSCGRTDLPGGDWDAIQDSLARLARLNGDLNVYSGHGEASTLERERKFNPYMR